MRAWLHSTNLTKKTPLKYQVPRKDLECETNLYYLCYFDMLYIQWHRLDKKDVWNKVHLNMNINLKKTPWPQFVSELYRSSDRCLLAKLVWIFCG
jgi:hypothetical protein